MPRVYVCVRGPAAAGLNGTARTCPGAAEPAWKRVSCRTSRTQPTYPLARGVESVQCATRTGRARTGTAGYTIPDVDVSRGPRTSPRTLQHAENTLTRDRHRHVWFRLSLVCLDHQQPRSSRDCFLVLCASRYTSASRRHQVTVLYLVTTDTPPPCRCVTVTVRAMLGKQHGRWWSSVRSLTEWKAPLGLHRTSVVPPRARVANGRFSWCTGATIDATATATKAISSWWTRSNVDIQLFVDADVAQDSVTRP